MTDDWMHTAISVVVIVVLALVVRAALIHLINRSVAKIATKAEQRVSALDDRAAQTILSGAIPATERQAHRTRTLGTLLRSLVNTLIAIVAVLMILQSFNINIAPALASAGIGGLALGFGAQSLVKDVISGVFLIVEDQFGVGDWVTIDSVSGTVQSVGLRVTRLQDSSGQMWYVRNGEIVTLGNQSQGWSSGFVKFPVALDQDPYQVMEILNEVCSEIDADANWRPTLLETPTAAGLSEITPVSATYSIAIKTPGNKQWATEREIRARVMHRFVEAGISTPNAIGHC